MSTTTLSPEEIYARYQLLCRSTQVQLQPHTLEQQIQPHLQRLHDLLTNDLRALARQGSPDDFTDLYFALQQELKRFHEFCSFPALAQKVLVAFGGGFSAGKSSLINALLGERLLVTEIDPTTSLPTYLLRGKGDAIQAHNLFGHCIDLTLEEFRSLTHDEVANYGSNISRLLRSAFISRADFPWQHLAIIDTPGYTKHENPVHGDRTDEQLARNQLNAAHAIVWVIDARKGCITEDDLNFLATLQPDIPRMMVLTRADQKSADDVCSIVAGIRHTLQERNLPFVDVLAVSARKKKEWPLEPVRAQLAAWSTAPRTPRFDHNFKTQFASYSHFIEEEQRHAQRHLNRLRQILVMGDMPEVQTAAEELQRDTEYRLQRSQIHGKALQDLRQQFFTELKAIDDVVNIALPEPSDWDMGTEGSGPWWMVLIAHREAQEVQAPEAPEAPEALLNLMKAGTPDKLLATQADWEQRLCPNIAATRLDTHSRMVYARLLAALLTVSRTQSEAQSHLFKTLLATMQLEDVRANLYAQVADWNTQELQECQRVFTEEALARHLVLDALILCRLGGPLTPEQVQCLTETAHALQVRLEELGALANLAGYILGFNKAPRVFIPKFYWMMVWMNFLPTSVNSKIYFSYKNQIACELDISSEQKNSIKKRIIYIIAENLGIEESIVKKEKSFINDLGADFLDIAELAMKIEDEFGIEIDDGEMEQMTTVKDVIEYVVKNQIK